MTLQLSAKVRTLPTPQLNQTRQAGQVPAELYGRAQANQHLLLELKALEKIYAQAGESSLIDLIIDDEHGKSKTIKAVISDLQYSPLKNKIRHVDFHQVRMDEKIQAKVALIFVGESKAVKELGGTLIKSLEEVEVSCLPADLIHQIEVDISVLENLNQMIKVADLKAPPSIKLVSPAEQVVVAVKPALKEKAVEAAPAASAATEATTAPAATETTESKEAKKEAKKEEKK